jgi:hypothetical protein
MNEFWPLDLAGAKVKPKQKATYKLQHKELQHKATHIKKDA